jgi:hypothetical protein
MGRQCWRSRAAGPERGPAGPPASLRQDLRSRARLRLASTRSGPCSRTDHLTLNHSSSHGCLWFRGSTLARTAGPNTRTPIGEDPRSIASGRRVGIALMTCPGCRGDHRARAHFVTARHGTPPPRRHCPVTGCFGGRPHLAEPSGRRVPCTGARLLRWRAKEGAHAIATC